MDISPQLSPNLSLSTWHNPIIKVEGGFPPVLVHPDAHPDTYPSYDQEPTMCKYLQVDSYPAFCSQSTCTHNYKHFVIRADSPEDSPVDSAPTTQNTTPHLYDFFSQ